MTGHVKIEAGKDWPQDTKVFLNGIELEGLCSVDLHLSSTDFPTVTFTIEPSAIECEGLAELRAHFPPEDEDEARI